MNLIGGCPSVCEVFPDHGTCPGVKGAHSRNHLLLSPSSFLAVTYSLQEAVGQPRLILSLAWQETWSANVDRCSGSPMVMVTCQGQ